RVQLLVQSTLRPPRALVRPRPDQAVEIVSPPVRIRTTMRKGGAHMLRKAILAIAMLDALAISAAVSASPPSAPGTIAFSADNQIFVARNGQTTQLTHDDIGVVGIAWSPDGSRMLAWRYRLVPAISVVNSDGSIRPQVASRVDGEPRWSPDGKWIASQR